MQARMFSKEHRVLSSVLNMERAQVQNQAKKPRVAALVCSMLVVGMLGVVSVADNRGLLKTSFPKTLFSSWNKASGMFVQNLRNGGPVGLQNAPFPQPRDKVRVLILASSGSKASVWCINVLFVCLLQNHALVLSFLETPKLSSTIRKISTCWLGKLYCELKHDLSSKRHSIENCIEKFLGCFFRETWMWTGFLITIHK